MKKTPFRRLRIVTAVQATKALLIYRQLHYLPYLPEVMALTHNYRGRSLLLETTQ